jgi:membrane protein involved in colicin uptake
MLSQRAQSQLQHQSQTLFSQQYADPPPPQVKPEPASLQQRTTTLVATEDLEAKPFDVNKQIEEARRQAVAEEQARLDREAKKQAAAAAEAKQQAAATAREEQARLDREAKQQAAATAREEQARLDREAKQQAAAAAVTEDRTPARKKARRGFGAAEVVSEDAVEVDISSLEQPMERKKRKARGERFAVLMDEC